MRTPRAIIGWRRQWPLFAALPAFFGVQAGIAFSERQLGQASLWQVATELVWVHLGIWLAFCLAILLLVTWSTTVLGTGKAVPLVLAALALSPELLIWFGHYLPASSGAYTGIPMPEIPWRAIRVAEALELPGRVPYGAFFNTDVGRWSVGLANPPVSTAYFYLVWHWLMNVVGWITIGALAVSSARVWSMFRLRRRSQS